MPRVDLILETNIERTPRVVQLEGMFDVPSAEKTRVEFHFDVGFDERPWNIGLVVGPSGAGKSSVAEHLFGDALVRGYEWHPTRAVVDSFGELSIRETTAALSSVGFSSAPNWLRPFRVLSNGEQFRATMARALVDPRPLLCIDEFTSVVDRQVAQIGSHAIARSIRSRGKKLVAVTCHYDVTEWLQPDWVLEPHLGRFAWRSLQRRPDVALEIVRCDHSSWRWFAAHHYLSAKLHKGARCFVGLVNGDPACFAGIIHFPHPKVRDIASISRLVVRPDYQGLGLSLKFIDFLGAMAKTMRKRLHGHPAHPALIRVQARSPNWNMVSPPRFSSQAKKTTMPWFAKTIAVHRRVAHFEYVGPAFKGEMAEAARQLWKG